MRAVCALKDSSALRCAGRRSQALAHASEITLRIVDQAVILLPILAHLNLQGRELSAKRRFKFERDVETEERWFEEGTPLHQAVCRNGHRHVKAGAKVDVAQDDGCQSHCQSRCQIRFGSRC